MSIYAINPSWWMRRSATTGHRDREVKRNARISALFPIGYIFEEVFGLNFEACCAEAEGMVLGIGVAVAGTGDSTGDTPRQHCIGSNSTR